MLLYNIIYNFVKSNFLKHSDFLRYSKFKNLFDINKHMDINNISEIKIQIAHHNWTLIKKNWKIQEFFLNF